MNAGTYRDTLRHRGLHPFLWTQFLGAFNDNLFKIVVSVLAVRGAAGADAGRELSLVGAIFILPFLLFSGHAGRLADVYSKRRVLVVTKSLEIAAAALGLLAFLVGRLELMYVGLFLLALQSTFFSPAKYGILPEMLPDRDLSRANGILEMSTFVAIVTGTAIGGFMVDLWPEMLWIVGLFVLAVAAAGTLTSLRIPDVPAARPGGAIGLNPWDEIGHGLKRLQGDRVLRLTVVGISYFWFLGALLQLVVILFGTQVMGLADRWIGILTTCAAVGIGIGSIVAGRLSGDKVELGLAPIGAIGMGVFSVLLSLSGQSFALASINLAFVGFFAGFFAVPLHALLQQRPGTDEKGRLIATNNFLNMIGVLLASAALWISTGPLALSPDRIILVFGILTLGSSAYVLATVPEFLVRFSLWLLTHTFYRIRIIGQEHVPFRGPALLVCNHLSHVDGLLVGACVQRFIRFLVYRPYYEHGALNWLMRLMHAIPVGVGGRDALLSLQRARQELVDGHVVCIFAEGAISRTGNLLPFKRGFERIVEGLDVPIVPVYIDVWGSIFSHKGGKFFWKWPATFPYPVAVAFGRPLPSSTTAAQARQAVTELGCTVAGDRLQRDDTLPRRFVRTAKGRWGALCMADSTGRPPLTFGRALVGSLLLSQWIVRHSRNEESVGLLLPSSVGGALANIGVSMAGKIPVNLNFTAGSEAIAYAIERCGIKTVITSRTFLSKAGVEQAASMVFLEDLLKNLGRMQKLWVLVAARLLPARVLIRLFLRDGSVDSTGAIIFSSGSTGVPKGVALTHRSVLANIRSANQILETRSEDVIVGVLPFFHSFGFTGTLWFPLVTGFAAVYHPNPMDAKTIGELAARYRATLLISTPTFCASYVRKCQPEQFAHLRYAIVGAEKLRESVAAAFQERFGVALSEGYGCTEMAPIVAANLARLDDQGETRRDAPFGSVGCTLPGVAAKVVDPVTVEGLPFSQDGLLLVKGPNLMAGYLGEPEKTREVVRDGWYVTGDIASMDEDGAIRITDRLSRFSKIAGEMVPHMKVEDCINAALEEPYVCVVTSAPDDVRGERLVALFTDPGMTPQKLWERLCQSELPRLWLPKRDDLRFIESVPTLGSGKVDLRAVRRLAMEEKPLVRT